jgi:hypothetical protein
MADWNGRAMVLCGLPRCKGRWRESALPSQRRRIQLNAL